MIPVLLLPFEFRPIRFFVFLLFVNSSRFGRLDHPTSLILPLACALILAWRRINLNR